MVLLALLLLASLPSYAEAAVGRAHSLGTYALVRDISELPLEERQKIQARLKLRRKMVPVHQTFALLAAGFIVATEVVGTINSAALEEGEPRYKDLKPGFAMHRALALTSFSLYLTAGMIAWTMPEPFVLRATGAAPDKKKADSGEIHKALSLAHGIGMATMAATGLLMANVADNRAWPVLKTVHAVTGYTTATLIFTAAIVINTL
jgi:hypothetical protein